MADDLDDLTRYEPIIVICVHPKRGKLARAQLIPDYFGDGINGVRFDGATGEVFLEHKVVEMPSALSELHIKLGTTG